VLFFLGLLTTPLHGRLLYVPTKSKSTNQQINKSTNQLMDFSLFIIRIIYPNLLLTLHWVSLIRPAPAELPQDRKVARVSGRSGAMSGLPFFDTGTLIAFRHSDNLTNIKTHENM
jgi:pilus assembly protein TadC